MIVECIKENEDGTAKVEVYMTKEELTAVIEVGFTKMRKDGMEAFEDELKPDKSGK